MLNKLLNDRLRFLITIVKRSSNIRSDSDLASQMKLLNDNKQYKKAFELFDEYKENKIETFSNLTIIQVLKASAQIIIWCNPGR
ncbi:unnamed protein product [Adineta steineri]|uniref:Uncharacterized protein n=1 Tax=Adineta steineri TaxID=433720 RepID=A0A818XY39_9BILA|nr:unnamed protein product [Adineta steineri]CAF0993628.1 unnamed protein product [Adineta steineri]CAF1062617.1 unnamed protein product [Adineta steineri]CAF3500953.1 unnamed protein product [Adineta steineri]CAF3744941.1 unnamed protein product [Adineta steineri]